MELRRTLDDKDDRAEQIPKEFKGDDEIGK